MNIRNFFNLLISGIYILSLCIECKNMTPQTNIILLVNNTGMYSLAYLDSLKSAKYSIKKNFS